MNGVVCRLPRAGLGNQLFPLMKALVLAELNQYPYVITGYRRFKPWHYLRAQKDRRIYADFFNFEKPIISQYLDEARAASWMAKHHKEEEAPLQIYNKKGGKGNIYYYSKVPSYTDYFEGLKEYRSLVKTLFQNVINLHVKQQAAAFPDPVIGVHVRMGDFKKLQPHDDFSKIGQGRTPEEYFINSICQIRKTNGADLPVSVFTNGYRSEFKKLFNLPAVNMIEGNSAIADMLLLSRSKIIVASASSTFGYWAGFLSEAPLIMHPDHVYAPIRKAEDGLYEGPMDVNNSTLVNAIAEIKMPVLGNYDTMRIR